MNKKGVLIRVKIRIKEIYESVFSLIFSVKSANVCSSCRS